MSDSIQSISKSSPLVKDNSALGMQLKVAACIEVLQSLTKEQRWEFFQKLECIPYSVKVGWSFVVNDQDDDVLTDYINRSVTIDFNSPFCPISISGIIEEVECDENKLYLDGSSFCLLKDDCGDRYTLCSSNGWAGPVKTTISLNRECTESLLFALGNHFKKISIDVDISKFFANRFSGYPIKNRVSEISQNRFFTKNWLDISLDSLDLGTPKNNFIEDEDDSTEIVFKKGTPEYENEKFRLDLELDEYMKNREESLQ